MGRECGFIAVNAALASRDVNICLIPEITFQLYGKHGVYEKILERADKKGHCIIVVAEGAYRGLIEDDKKIVDEGNPAKCEVCEAGEDCDEVHVDLATFIKKDLGKYAQQEKNIKLTIKYLDPKKAIRAVEANSQDTDLCHRLAYTSAHAAMAGYTDFGTGMVRTQPVMIPFVALTTMQTKILKRKDHDWQRLLLSTGQSNFLSPENQAKALKEEKQLQLWRQHHYMELKVRFALGIPFDQPLKVDQRESLLVGENQADYLNF